MSDLIERMRLFKASYPTLPSCRLLGEAADEIERLRGAPDWDAPLSEEEIARLRGALRHTAACNNERLRQAGFECPVCDGLSKQALGGDDKVSAPKDKNTSTSEQVQVSLAEEGMKKYENALNELGEIKPTKEQLSDPYVLQLIEALAMCDDHIEQLEGALDIIVNGYVTDDHNTREIQGIASKALKGVDVNDLFDDFFTRDGYA